MHFGRGIVASQEDFGSQGKLPTHPELLDWLAGRFMDERMGRQGAAPADRVVGDIPAIVGGVARVMLRDPDNLLLARGPKTRLMAEQIRDSALAASGLLNRDDRRTERQAVSARGPVGAIRHGQVVHRGHGAQAVSPQPLHVLEAHVAAAVDDDVRRRVA